jgi:sortase A
LLLVALILALAVAGVLRALAPVYWLVKAELAQILIARAWQQSRQDGVAVKPWPWADTYPVARLRVPRLGIDQYLLDDASNRNLAFGGAHVAGSGWPGDDQSTVFAGHRDSHFAFLQQLRTGDEIILETDRRHRYRVNRWQIMDSRSQQLPLTNSEQLILTTCYPFRQWTAGGPLRYLVLAEPVAIGAGEPDKRSLPDKEPIKSRSRTD